MKTKRFAKLFVLDPLVPDFQPTVFNYLALALGHVFANCPPRAASEAVCESPESTHLLCFQMPLSFSIPGRGGIGGQIRPVCEICPAVASSL